MTAHETDTVLNSDYIHLLHERCLFVQWHNQSLQTEVISNFLYTEKRGLQSTTDPIIQHGGQSIVAEGRGLRPVLKRLTDS